MTIRHLRMFLAVCETGTTIAAAQQLHVSQPTVSAAISEMEHYYGVCLFDRINRRMCLTDAGARLREYASHIVSSFDEMERAAGELEDTGRLRIASSIIIGTALLPGFLCKLKNTFPALKPEVVICNSEQVEQRVLRNEADIGFVEGSISHAELICREFARDGMVFLCTPSHHLAGRTDVSPAEVAQEALLCREAGSACRLLVEGAFRSVGIEIAPVWQSISNEALISAASSGMGVAILPCLAARGTLERGETASFKVKTLHMERVFSCVYHRKKYMSRAMQALLEICLEQS